MTVRLKHILFCLATFLLTYDGHSQTDTTKNKLAFDFGITRNGNINVWPIFKRFRNADKSELQILFPVFTKKKDFRQHTKHFQIAPFFISDSSANGIDRRLFSLYYPSVFHFHKPSSGDTSSNRIRSFKFMELAPHISLLGISRSPKGLFVENNIFFFIWYKKDVVQNKTSLVVFPNYWYFANTKDTTQLLFPLFYKKNSATEKKLNVALLYNFKKNGDGRKQSLFPLWWNSTRYTLWDTVKKDVIFPFYWSKRSHDVNNKTFFPFVYSYKERERKSLTVFPFFSFGNNPAASKSHIVITPFYWHLESYKKKREVLFPFYWRTENYFTHDTITKTKIFPFYWSVKSKAENKTVFFPFYRSSEKRLYDGSIVTKKSFFPFYRSVKDKNENITSFFPFYKHKIKFEWKDTIHKKTILLIYSSTKSKYKNNRFLFPVLWSFNGQNGKSLTVFPFYSKGNNTDSSKRYFAVTPFYWHIKTKQMESNTLFPVFWSHKKFLWNDTVNKTSIFPVFFSTKSKSKNNTTIFPFFFSYQNKKRQSLTVFPFYSKGERFDLNRKHLVITPFYWHIKKNTGESEILFPFYWNQKKYLWNDTLTRKILFPFSWTIKSKAKNTNFTFPFYWKQKKFLKNDTIDKTVIFPIYWSVKSKSKNDLTLFPFVFKRKTRDKESLTVFPFFSYGKKKQSGNKFLAVTPFFWHNKTRHGESNFLFPFFRTSKKYSYYDTTKTTFLFPIFLSNKSKEKTNVTLFPFFSYGSRTDSSKSYLVVTPLFWDLKTRKNKIKLFLPFMYSYKSKERKSLTVFPLFSYGNRTDGSKSHLVITPFYWHTRTKKSESNVVFPFYWGKKEFLRNDTVFKKTLFPFYSQQKSKKESRHSALLFVFRNVKRQDYSKTSVLWPLCERLKEKNKSSFRIAPFVWSSKTDSSRMFSVQPIFYSYKSKTRKTFILSGYTFKYEKLEGKSVSTSFLWRFFYRKRYTNGDFETRFLHLVVANIKVGGRREKSFLPFFHSVSDTSGNKSKSIFFSFYNRFKEYRPEIKDFYEEERIFWFVRLRSNFNKLKSEGKIVKRK